MRALVKNGILVVLSGWLAMCISPAQERREHKLAMGADGKLKVSIVVTCAFSQIPLHGFAPIRVTIDNQLASDLDWKIHFDSHTEDDKFASNFKLEAKRNSSTTAELMVPVPTRFSNWSHTYDHGIRYSLKADRYPTETGSFGSAFPSDWPSIIMSRTVAVRNEGPLSSAVNAHNSSIETFAATFDPEWLPSDWRGYSGVDIIILTDTEWMNLQSKMPSVSQAMLEWSRLGGRLDIYSANGAQPQAVRNESVESNHHSLGKLNFLSWNNSEFDPDTMVEAYRTITPRRSRLSDPTGSTRQLIDLLGTRSFGTWQIATILIAFGVIVGPVNLFVIARQGRRHRLFWTTPLISLIASLLLIALILYQDGTGGKGRRFMLVNVEPDETSAFVTQFQAARTGVLFSGAFEARDTYISQASLGDSPWAAIDEDGGLAKRYNLDGNIYGGDWFQSRREHGHHLQAVRSTRGRVERVSAPGETPTLVSSFGFSLRRIYYIDDSGTFWISAGPANAGERVTLEKTTKESVEKLLPSVVHSTPTSTVSLHQAGQFVALADAAPDLTIETLSSISWHDTIVLFGPVPVSK